MQRTNFHSCDLCLCTGGMNSRPTERERERERERDKETNNQDTRQVSRPGVYSVSSVRIWRRTAGNKNHGAAISDSARARRVIGWSVTWQSDRMWFHWFARPSIGALRSAGNLDWRRHRQREGGRKEEWPSRQLS